MTDATSDAEAGADAAEGSEDEPQPFENRAARRAKGKGTANHTRGGQDRVTGRSSTVQSPRQYGNRRSG